MAGLEWIVVGLMVLVNALFAAYEIALASVTKARLQALKEQGRFGAHSAIIMKDRIDGVTEVVQVA